MISINNNTNTIDICFNSWGLKSYGVFLQSKNLPEYNLTYDWKTDSYQLKAPARFAHIFGLDDVVVDRGWLALSNYLFDYQKFILETALAAKRYAVWADTGLGKTAIGLEFARQVAHRTGGRFLMIAPLNIIPQTIDEAARFYGDEYKIKILENREELKAWATGVGVKSQFAITNPAKFIPRNNEPEIISEIQHLAGVWLDESSILKTGGGTIKWALIKSCRGLEYKLSTTATPAPNDTMEYASQGSFLEKLRSEGEILWTFFIRDKQGNWKVKDHAKDAFYRFMSGWSVYLKNPKNYGFEDNLKNLPKPTIKEYKIHPTEEQRDLIRKMPDAAGQLSLFGKGDTVKLGISERSKYSQLAKGFMYAGEKRKAVRYPSLKPGFVVDLILKDLDDGSQILVWTVFDEESDIISEILDVHSWGFTYATLSGKTPKAKRPAIVEDFRKGKIDVLISKASLLGFGLNFQNCGAMIFSGFNDSFEQFYQAVRRAYRYGQTESVKIYIPYIPELEGIVWDNVMRKQDQFIYDTNIQERNYLKAIKGVLNGIFKN